MKKIILSIAILSGFLILSCDNNEILQDSNSITKNSDALQRQSSMIGDVESMYIEGLGNEGCGNNILIFSTWDKYWATIEELDEMIESECDAFDATVPNNVTDDEYDALALAAGFDEDNALIKFEQDLDFCSLRSKINTLENAWLDLQGDGVWDANADPDNHFIDDETERTLLSYNAEVIIGDSKRGYVYYKFLNDTGDWIEVHNMDLEAIAQVSQGNIPVDNPNVVVVKPQASGNSCKDKVKEVS